MIYDRLMTVYDRDDADTRELINPASYLYGEKEVYGSTFYQAMQAGEQADAMIELWRADIHAEQFCALDDGRVYRVVQARHGLNDDGLPITTLTLRRMEGRYDAVSNLNT